MVSLGGCQLIVDFDRGKIDAGGVDAAQDATVADSAGDTTVDTRGDDRIDSGSDAVDGQADAEAAG